LSAFGRRFGLSEQRGHGVSCDQTALFVGAVPLLEPCRNCAGFQKWRPRPMDELNRDLSNRYGVPVQLDAKLEALAPLPVRLIVAICCMRTSPHYICRFPIHRRLRKPRGPQARWSLWRSSSTPAACSREAVIRRSIRAGRPEASTVSADASRRLMRHLVRRRVTNQALRPERRKHCQYRLRP
jgi:hypothetical protein